MVEIFKLLTKDWRVTLYQGYTISYFTSFIKLTMN